MINFKKNNLDQATSPYLQQHKDNPLHWQEWSNEVLEYAQQNNKLIFVSVGYATCHWCHVMAREAFSNQEIADFLNTYFVSIKVDREQRPDIDNYLMSFIQERQGQGGWPLNVFLTPDIKPILAVTYVPIEPRYGLPKFLDLVQHLKKNYENNGQEIQRYTPHLHPDKHIREQELIQVIKDNFTGNGFGSGPQFPPHNTLLFLLSYYEKNRDLEIKNIVETILEVMAKSGLHDHLQGGFYRYCVDYSWTIAHFEKMLYDQAMLLWVYSLAYKMFKNQAHKAVAEKIITCLEETFVDGLYYAGHDADTDHHEGSTYLWDNKELQQHLSPSEYEQFKMLYLLEPNFEERIHLLKQKNIFLPQVEKKLLQIRRQRKQPFTDTTFITSWNALLGIAFIISYRSFGTEMSRIKAMLLFRAILNKHYQQEILHHSSHEGKLQPGEFLEDYASMLLLATYLYEETGSHKDLIRIWYEKLNTFHGEQWIESKTTDFMTISAPTLDHPVPSGVSLAEMATLRASIILQKEYALVQYKQPLQYDFYNLMAFINTGNWHILHIPHKIEWKHLPSNCMQIYNTQIQDCYGQRCMIFKDITQLLASLR